MKTAGGAWLAFALVNALAKGQVTIDPTPRQTLTSFGTSGAWWPNDIALFPAAVQRNLTHLLFSEEGLHLSSYRYNIGADSGNASKYVETADRVVGSFLRSDGSYDWSQDAAGVKILKAAQRYRVPYITFFVNAAPSYIADGKTCGWSLTEEKVGAFAAYLKTVLAYWTKRGISIKYISPMNEPDYAHPECGQEGMAIDPKLRPTVLRTLREALDNSSAHHTSIIADETSQLTQARHEYKDWLNASAPYISHLAIHNYDFPSDADVRAYHSLTTNLTLHAPPVKFTESCCATSASSGPGVFGPQYDPTIANALIAARHVWQFLTLAQAESFDWWSAVADLPCSPSTNGPQCATDISAEGWNSALFYIDPEFNKTRDYTLYPTKRAWLMKHLATFHRPGSVRFDVHSLPDDVNAIASARKFSLFDEWDSVRGTSIGRAWSVLFINSAAEARNMSFVLPGGYVAGVRSVRTTDRVDWEEGSVDVCDGAVEVELPSKSLVTLHFKAYRRW